MTDGESTRRRSLGVLSALCKAPFLVGVWFVAHEPRALWQLDVATLLMVAVSFAFFVRRTKLAIGLLVYLPVILGLFHVLAAGWLEVERSFANGAAFGLLVLAVAVAALGLAWLGRSLGASRSAAGVATLAVLVVAMLGLLWADPVGDRLPQGKRYAFKQAVLHVDIATAAAYGAASFDRFHDPVIYREVDVAADAPRAPGAVPTGLLWLVVGLVSGAAAWLLGRRKAVESEA